MKDGLRYVLEILERRPDWTARVKCNGEFEFTVVLAAKTGARERSETFSIPDLDNADFDLIGHRLQSMEREIVEWIIQQHAAEHTAGE